MSEKPESPFMPPLAPGEKPAFMQPAAATTPYPGITPDDAVPTFDHEVPEAQLAGEPSRELRTRWLEIARLHALGMSNNQICDRLGYTASRISILLAMPEMKTEVARYRNKLFDQDLINAMKDLGPDAMSVVAEMLHSGGEKLKDRADTAKWLLEKLTGRAKQEVNVESNTLAAFMDMVRSMREHGEKFDAAPVIDVTPEVRAELPALTTAESNPHAQWIKENL